MKYSIRKISAIVIVVMILVMLPIVPKMKVFAAAGTLYESEANDTPSTADVTNDDYTNYGTLGHNTDIDCWKITFSQSGIANFWLGNPTGYNYDLRLYRYTSGSYALVAEATSTKNQEIIRARVYAGEIYCAMIYGPGTVAPIQYQFRIKRYDITDKARLFTYAYTTAQIESQQDPIDTTGDANVILPELWAMGYDAGNYRNNTVGPVFNTMPSTSIFIFDGHGGWHTPYLNCSGTELYGKLTEEILEEHSNYRALTKLVDDPNDNSEDEIKPINNINLSKCDLMIFSACYSGSYHSQFSNLVDEARKNSARCAIGWSDRIQVTHSTHWLSKFLESAGNGNNVAAAVSAAIHSTSIYYGVKSEVVVSLYSGSSPLNSLIIG